MKIKKICFLLLLLSCLVPMFSSAQEQPSKEELVIALDGKPLQHTFKLNITKDKVGLDLVAHGEIESGELIVYMRGPFNNSDGGLRISAKQGKRSKGQLYETINAPGEWTIEIKNDTGIGKVVIKTEKSVQMESSKPIDLNKGKGIKSKSIKVEEKSDKLKSPKMKEQK